MGKKIIMLLMFVFLLCGCTAKVDINIDKRNIDETITITDFANEAFTKEQVLAKYRKYMPVDKSTIIVDTEPDERKSRVDYYKRSVTDLGNGYNILYNYNFDYEEYFNARSLNTAFKSSFINYNKEENTITISTDNEGTKLFGQYKELDKLQINISSSYPIIESNADSVNGSVSTWNLSRDSNKKIYIKYNTKLKQEQKEEEEEEETIPPSGSKEEEEKESIPFGIAILYVLLGVVGLILIVIIVSKIDSRKYR